MSIGLEDIAGISTAEEGRAVALATYNQLPKWIEITDDPASLPPLGIAVIIRVANSLEGFGCLDEWTEAGEATWHKIITPIWDRYTQRVDSKASKVCDVSVTHWRAIG